MSVYGYARVSTLQQANEGESLDVQKRQIEGYCSMQGWMLQRMYVERGVSGSIAVAERPVGAKLWAGLRKGDTVIAAKLDRLFRSALDALQTVERIKEMGVSLVLIDLGGDVTGNGMAKTFMTIVAAFAEAERDRIRERVSGAKADQRTRGRYLGGVMPFGFARGADGELVEVPADQAAIADARAMRAEGATFRAIQAAIEARYGRRLALDAWHRILTSNREITAGQ
jgi:putative DNA-invertase from lambdoid prophage Rac